MRPPESGFAVIPAATQTHGSDWRHSVVEVWLVTNAKSRLPLFTVKRELYFMSRTVVFIQSIYLQSRVKRANFQKRLARAFILPEWSVKILRRPENN